MEIRLFGSFAGGWVHHQLFSWGTMVVMWLALLPQHWFVYVSSRLSGLLMNISFYLSNFVYVNNPLFLRFVSHSGTYPHFSLALVCARVLGNSQPLITYSLLVSVALTISRCMT